MPLESDRAAKARAVIDRQRKALLAIADDLSTNIPQWKDRTIRMLSGLVVPDEIRLLSRISTETWTKDKAAFLQFMDGLEQG